MCNNVLLIIYFQFFMTSLMSMVLINDELYEGNHCMLEDGDMGICKKLPDCPSRLEEVRKGRRSSVSAGRCGFENFTEIVCCPVNITDKIGLRPAEIACQQYDNEIAIDTTKSKSDDVTFHIFGGTEAKSGEFPYMAALGYENDEDDDDAPSIRYSCGGTLIASQYVLTAAHCVNNLNDKVPIEVRLGNENVKNATADVKRIPISNIISHPQYKRSTNYNDVALLKLGTKAQFTSKIKPICLQTKPLENTETMTRASLVVIGWGSTSFDNDGSDQLMKTPNLSFVDRNECSKFYNGFLKLPRGLDENMICALDNNTTRRADACQGDSGGPLLMLAESGDSIVGVTAFGQTCGGSVPGVYTSVYPYLDWIEEHVWPDSEED